MFFVSSYLIQGTITTVIGDLDGGVGASLDIGAIVGADSETSITRVVTATRADHSSIASSEIRSRGVAAGDHLDSVLVRGMARVDLDKTILQGKLGTRTNIVETATRSLGFIVLIETTCLRIGQLEMSRHSRNSGSTQCNKGKADHC